MRHKLALYIERMNGLSPLKKLNQGYSYVEDASGKTVKSVSQTEAGDRLCVYMSDGTVETEVKAVKRLQGNREDIYGGR